MEALLAMKVELQTALDLIQAFEDKKTKAASGRVRIALGEIKKHVTDVRASLVASDKTGY